MQNLAQSIVVLIASGSCLTMAIVIQRWTASIEARLRRIDSFLERNEDQR